MSKRYRIATQMGYLDEDFRTKAKAVKALREEVKDAAQRCRKSYGTCSVVGSATEGNVEIRIGGKRGFNIWNRYAIRARD